MFSYLNSCFVCPSEWSNLSWNKIILLFSWLFCCCIKYFVNFTFFPLTSWKMKSLATWVILLGAILSLDNQKTWMKWLFLYKIFWKSLLISQWRKLSHVPHLPYLSATQPSCNLLIPNQDTLKVPDFFFFNFHRCLKT